MDCLSPSALRVYIDSDPVPRTAAQVTAFQSVVAAFDRACARHTPSLLLGNMSTEATAFDLDRLRQALGQAKLDYLGFSYGTYIGYVYALAFPGHVRAMVLDGAVDPSLGVEQSALSQARSLEVDLHDFFRWCPTSSTCHSLLPHGAARAFATLTARLEHGASLTANLIPSVGGMQRIHYGDALTGLVAPLYSRLEWRYLAQAIEEGLRGDGTLLAELAFQYNGVNANGTIENVDAANAATICADHPTSYSISQLRSLAQAWARRAPDFGPVEAYGLYGCTLWPVHSAPRLVVAHGVRLPPVVVVGSTHDPVTPYQWAVALARLLPHSVLLTRVGEGHTGYFFSSCVQRQVDSYLTTLKPPAAHTVCPSNAG